MLRGLPEGAHVHDRTSSTYSSTHSTHTLCPACLCAYACPPQSRCMIRVSGFGESHAPAPVTVHGHQLLPKLSDAGRSLQREHAAPHAAGGRYGGLDHLAPEVLLEPQRACAPPADVYSLGVILWRMLTSLHPWAGLSHQQVIEAVAHEGRVLAFPAGAPDAHGLQELALRCMAHAPAARPAAAEVCTALEGMLLGGSG